MTVREFAGVMLVSGLIKHHFLRVCACSSADVKGCQRCRKTAADRHRRQLSGLWYNNSGESFGFQDIRLVVHISDIGNRLGWVVVLVGCDTEVIAVDRTRLL